MVFLELRHSDMVSHWHEMDRRKDEIARRFETSRL